MVGATNSIRLGPSPRRRGHPMGQAPAVPRHGSIPAQAGSPVHALAMLSRSGVHPRAGGVTAFSPDEVIRSQGPSPRRRGHPDGTQVSEPSFGSIPAQAGSPLPAKSLIPFTLSNSDGPHQRETRTPSRSASCRGGEPSDSNPKPPAAWSSRHIITMEPSAVAACQSETTAQMRSRTPFDKSAAVYTPGAGSGMIEARKPRVRAGTSRVTITVIGITRPALLCRCRGPHRMARSRLPSAPAAVPVWPVHPPLVRPKWS